jgi:hypothetical protein
MPWLRPLWVTEAELCLEQGIKEQISAVGKRSTVGWRVAT